MFVVYDSITKEVACTYDDEESYMVALGRFTVKEYPFGTAPVFRMFEDGNETTLLIESTTMFASDFFDERSE